MAMGNVDDKKEESANESFRVSAPQVALPKGGGAISGIGEKFAANPVTGTGSMTIPIAVSPGRSGFGPSLVLSYDSGAGNGPFGLGWNLYRFLPSRAAPTKDCPATKMPLCSFCRAPKISYPAWASTPKAIGCGNQVSATATWSTQYRPRIEGLFSRIERWTRQSDGDTHWRSISRSNVTTFYGRTPESRIADPEDSNRVFTWLICESFDDKGNAIVYAYVPEDSSNVDPSLANEQTRTQSSRTSNRYLKRIQYGNTTSRLIEPDLTKLSWLFELVFDYDEGHFTSLPTDSEGREFATASVNGTQALPSRYPRGFRTRDTGEVSRHGSRSQTD